MKKSRDIETENLFVLSKSFDPLFNLAVEEYLTANIKFQQVILYLWQNDNTIVIGSNQNPWKECNIDKIRENEIKLVRRQSGGGAVFHDKGNLNFTFIANNDLFDIEKHFTVILNAVNSFGLNARFSGRNDLLIEDKKFSGNAFYSNDEVSYHHGTILIDSDLSKLSKFLTPSEQKIKSNGVDSVKARVINLKSLSNLITVESMKEGIIKSFIEQYGNFSITKELDKGFYDSEEFSNMINKYASWKWIYGDSPTFEAVHNRKFQWGEVEIGFNLTDGKITNTKIYTDSLVTTFSEKLSKALKDVRYEAENIKKAIDGIDSSQNEKQIFLDIKELFEGQC